MKHAIRLVMQPYAGADFGVAGLGWRGAQDVREVRQHGAQEKWLARGEPPRDPGVPEEIHGIDASPAQREAATPSDARPRWLEHQIGIFGP